MNPTESNAVFVPENPPKPVIPETFMVPTFEHGAPGQNQTLQRSENSLTEANAIFSNLKISDCSASQSSCVPEQVKTTPSALSPDRALVSGLGSEIVNAANAMVAFDTITCSPTPRPLVVPDMSNSRKEQLVLSGIPTAMTYRNLFDLVQPFGEIESLKKSPKDPRVCEVIYTDPSSLTEAVQYLDNAIVGSEKEPLLKAELRTRESVARLFVGDLTPDVTEVMLEEKLQEIVGARVTAVLKRDPETFSPIGYGFLTFQSENDANSALISGHGVQVGKARIRLGRAERNTHLYVPDLNPDVTRMS